jgi:NNP family nitrate/nitrite transporter-like MFS transporter
MVDTEPTSAAIRTARPRPALATTVATIGFGLSFWAWILLVPLEPDFQARFGLGHTAQALLLAVPVLVGSLGRIPVGVLTDRYGPGVLVPAVSLASAVGVCSLAYEDSLPS